MMKILIVRIGAIGDVVHTTNLYRSVKNKHNNVEIHYLTSELIKPLLIEDVDISKVITLPKNIKIFSADFFELVKQLKKENYDCVFDLQPSIKIRLLLFMAKIKNHYIYKKNFKVHAVKNFWQTGLKAFNDLDEMQSLKLYLPKTSIESAKERLKNVKHPVIVFNPGGMFAKRQGRSYPLDKWLELGNKLQEITNGTIILNGVKEDKEFLKPLENIKNSINLIGELSLADSCAVISQSDYMISGDSGPLHIATALNIKSIGLYGSMPVNRTGCYSNGINIVSKLNCVPCNKRKCKYLKGTNKIYAPCMEEISVGEIVDCFNKLK